MFVWQCLCSQISDELQIIKPTIVYASDRLTQHQLLSTSSVVPTFDRNESSDLHFRFASSFASLFLGTDECDSLTALGDNSDSVSYVE